MGRLQARGDGVAYNNPVDDDARTTGGAAGKRRGGEPLYRQVSRDLGHRIGDGEFGAVGQLPVEADLAAHYGVNRLTVREAVAELTRSGLVRRVQGRGSFVAAEPVHFVVTATSPSFTSVLRAEGRSYEQRLLDSRIDEDPGAREALDAPRARLRRLEVLLLVEGEPWSHSRTWLRDSAFPEVDRAYAPGAGGSLSGLLRQRFGIVVERAWLEWGAAPADPELADLMSVDPGSALLTQESLMVDGDGSPVLFIRRAVRSDRVRYRIDLR